MGNNNKLEGALGPTCGFSVAGEILKKNAAINLVRAVKGGPRFATCLWGTPGIGKTQFIKALENEPVSYNGKQYSGYRVIDVPPAQLEEMGDVLGMPAEAVYVAKDGKDGKYVPTSILEKFESDGWVIDTSKPTIMTYSAPAWVPVDDIPTVVLFDDWNRASSRIIKGVMQLLQNYGTIAWSLPPATNIVLTGNPDNGESMVTAIDDAISTRIKHITIKPNVDEWVAWAIKAGLNQTGISFVKVHPELIFENGERTNPRTWSEFCEHLNIEEAAGTDLTSAGVARLGEQVCDPDTISAFQHWMETDYKFTLDPEVVLTQPDVAENELTKMSNEKRLDIINISLVRLLRRIHDVVTDDEKVSEKELKGWIKNFQSFMLVKGMPKDCMMATLQTLIRMPGLSMKEMKATYKWVKGNATLTDVAKKLTSFDLESMGA